MAQDSVRAGPAPAQNRPALADHRPAITRNEAAHMVAPSRIPGPGQTATDGVATVSGSAFAPDNSRRLWALSYLCSCGLPHLGRARSYGDLGGWRRARCGRVVFVQIRRVYPPEASR